MCRPRALQFGPEDRALLRGKQGRFSFLLAEGGREGGGREGGREGGRGREGELCPDLTETNGHVNYSTIFIINYKY